MTNKYNQEEYLIKNGERFTILKKRKDGPKQIDALCKQDHCMSYDISEIIRIKI